MIGAPKILMG